MSHSSEASATEPRRPRGRPPRISRAKIVEVARSMPVESITMQAIADELGVDRKALNYHVTDREGLLHLVAAHAFESAVASLRIGEDDDWRDSVRALALAMKEGVSASGALAGYVVFESSDDLGALVPVEAVLRKLISAGFAEEDAGRAVVMLATFSIGFARDLAIASVGRHPQSAAVAEALRTETGDQFPRLRHLLDLDPYGPAQFAYDLRLFVLGLERLLPPQR